MSARKTYRIEVNDPEAIEKIEEMTKHYVTEGKNLVDAVVDHAQHYLAKKKKDFTLVTESELLRLSRERGYTTGKSSIVQYRRKGILRDKDGPWFFQNSENRVVYKLEKMMDFLATRHQYPKSRLSHPDKNDSRIRTATKARVVSREPAA